MQRLGAIAQEHGIAVGEEAGATTFTLPIGPALCTSDVERVISAVQELDHLPLTPARAARAGSVGTRQVSQRPCVPRSTTWAAGSGDAQS
jgi:hypothetical protein